MEFSTLFVMGVFALGVSVGGLMVSLQRQCSMARIKDEFEQQLRASVKEQREAEVTVQRLEQGKQVAAPVEEDFDLQESEGAYQWGHVSPSDGFGSETTHAGV